MIKERFDYFPIMCSRRKPRLYWPHRRLLQHCLSLMIKFKIAWVIVVSNGDQVNHFADIIIVDASRDSRIMEQRQGQLFVLVGTLDGEGIFDTILVMRKVHLKGVSKIF